METNGGKYWNNIIVFVWAELSVDVRRAQRILPYPGAVSLFISLHRTMLTVVLRNWTDWKPILPLLLAFKIWRHCQWSRRCSTTTPPSHLSLPNYLDSPTPLLTANPPPLPPFFPFSYPLTEAVDCVPWLPSAVCLAGFSRALTPGSPPGSSTPEPSLSSIIWNPRCPRYLIPNWGTGPAFSRNELSGVNL